MGLFIGFLPLDMPLCNAVYVAEIPSLFFIISPRGLHCRLSQCQNQLCTGQFIRTTTKKFLTFLINSEQECYFSPSCRRALEVSSSRIQILDYVPIPCVCLTPVYLPGPSQQELSKTLRQTLRQQLRSLTLLCFLRCKV